MTSHPNAHYFEGISFRADGYAEREEAAMNARLEAIRARSAELIDLGGEDTAAMLDDLSDRHRAATLAYWRSMGRCMSTMIAGPANFPVERNRKRMEVARKRSDEIYADLERALRSLERAAFPHGMPGDPIRGSDPQAIEKLTAKLEGLKGSRNYAERKRIQDRITVLTARQARGTTEQVIGGVRVVENVEADRIQMIWPNKPTDDERAVLKRRGFRWSPRFGAWQRHLNNNGRWAVRYALKDLGLLDAA